MRRIALALALISSPALAQEIPVETQTVINILTLQRNNAMDQLVMYEARQQKMRADLDAANAKVKELEAKLPKDQSKVPAK